MIKNLDKKKLAIGFMVVFICFVFIQSLFFKFTGSAETDHIFGTLDQWAADTFGIEGLFLPPGIFNAYVIGSAELIASVILLVGLFTKLKVFIPLGALMAMGVISGAIVFHLFTPLGVEVVVNGETDGGLLFFNAVGVWIAGLVIAYLRLVRGGALRPATA